MEKIIELRPKFKPMVIFLSIMILFSILGGIHIGLGYKTVFLVVFIALLYILHLINISNVIEFYNDRIKIQNLVTKKIKIFNYESISKIKFDTSKDVSFIKIKFKDGRSIKKLSNCGYGKMQDAEEKFRSIFPHMS